MKRLRIFLAIAIPILALFGAAAPELAHSIAPAPVGAPKAVAAPTNVYLPGVMRDATPQNPTSFDLIDQAVKNNQITAEQGLIYKVFAQFSDSRLPAQFVTSRIGRAGDLILQEAVAQAQAGTLSDSAKQTLTPFFVPPNDTRSWYYLSTRMGANGARAQADPPSWVFKPAVGGKVRVLYWSADADAEAKATGIAAELDAKIWSKLTTLMQTDPRPNAAGTVEIYLWDSYLKNDGTVVPFSASTLGITVPAACDQTSVTIYLPNREPIGSDVSGGLIQYTTHELMHAIQFALPMQSCTTYRWLMEATANWSEDYVYPIPNTEQGDAPVDYLNRASARLDDTTGLHHYGAYLLFYYLTHEIDPTASVVRLAWQNAATTPNSYKAVDDAVNQAAPAYHDYYWVYYLGTLWNKSPFRTFYTPDGLTASVATAGGAAINVTTTAGERAVPLPSELPTGGAMFYDLKFPDSSVRSLTILNGLGHKLSIGDATGSTMDTTTGDETYLLTDLANPADLQGITVALLLKAAGKPPYPGTGESIPSVLTHNGNSIPAYGLCLDAQGPMDEVVVVLSNSDFANPDRILKPTGLPVTVWANNVPCWQLQGNVTAIDYDNGVTEMSTGTVTFGWPSSQQGLADNPYLNLASMHFPQTELTLLNAQMTWTQLGARSDCTYDGRDTYTMDESSNDWFYLPQGLTPASPTYRGFTGSATASASTTVSDTVTCTTSGTTHDLVYPVGWSVPLSDFRSQIKISPTGAMSGDFTVPNYTGRYQRYTWNLTGVKK